MVQQDNEHVDTHQYLTGVGVHNIQGNESSPWLRAVLGGFQ